MNASSSALRRARLATAVREKAEAVLRVSLAGMSRRDAARWASARTTGDLGELVISWLHGEIVQTPGHCGPPCNETIPLIPVLEVLNRGGFITDNSQRAESADDGHTWNTWVSGWADDATLARIRAATAGTGLIAAACRRTSHECDRMPSFWFCPWHDSVCFWQDRCPAMGAVFSDLWYVSVEDPEPGRNDLLWGTLGAAFGLTAGCPNTGCAPESPCSGHGGKADGERFRREFLGGTSAADFLIRELTDPGSPEFEGRSHDERSQRARSVALRAYLEEGGQP